MTSFFCYCRSIHKNIQAWNKKTLYRFSRRKNLLSIDRFNFHYNRWSISSICRTDLIYCGFYRSDSGIAFDVTFGWKNRSQFYRGRQMRVMSSVKKVTKECFKTVNGYCLRDRAELIGILLWFNVVVKIYRYNCESVIQPLKN